MEISVSSQNKLLSRILQLKPEQQIFFIEKIYENLMRNLEVSEISEKSDNLPDWLVQNLDEQLKLLKKGHLKTKPWNEFKNELLQNLTTRKIEKIET